MISSLDLEPFRAVLHPRGVITDQDLIAPWLDDWRGRYHGAALAILEPLTTAEVAAAVKIAGQRGIALVPQGGNTSMVGGATPPADGSALILSLRKMNHIRTLCAQDNLALCEAGVILSSLHDAAAKAGRRFPLSLGAKGSATIGGLISTNAGGTQVLRHGTMRALVAGIEAVLPDGSIYDGLAALRKDNRGYDLRQLLIGAEGTLGIITAANLRLAPAITDSAVAWVSLPSPNEALALLRFLEAELGPCVEGFELVADDGLSHVLAYIPGARSPVASRGPWHALIEIDLHHEGVSAAAMIEQALGKYYGTGTMIDAAIAQNKTQAEEFWLLRESMSAAEKAIGPALQFDISVPVAQMPDFILETARDCEAGFAGVTASAYGHLGDGNVHFHVRAPEAVRDGAAWIASSGDTISRFVNDRVVSAGGSISAEHGIGQMKRKELARLASPAFLQSMCAIKHALDPRGIMNPEKLIPLASDCHAD